MLRDLYNKIPRFIRNKYFITGLAFIVWIIFLDRNNLVSQYKQRKELIGLKKERQFYLDDTGRDSAALRKLATDSTEAERIGREKYNMKRDSEDVFIIVRREKENK
jgi:cell division protein DivIC